jgi:WD40 repeat protein
VPELRIVKQLPEGQRVIALAFSPDSKILAAGGMNNWVSLWKLPEGKRVRRFMVKTQRYNGVRSLAFSPDGRFLAAGIWDGVIYLWQMPQGKLVATFVADRRKIRTVVSLVFSPDGKKLASLVEGDWFQLWDVRTKKLLWEREHNSACFSIAFTKDGRRLVGAGYTFLVLSTVDGSIISRQDLLSFYSPPGSVSADGQFIALYDSSGSVKVKRSHDFKDIWRASIISWKLKKQLHRWAERIEQRTSLPVTKLFPRPKLPFAFGAAFSRDNRWLALGFDNGQIKLWRIR